MIYRREIDGLRALAVLPVIFFHAGLSAFSGGFVGVDIFFVISGYLITSIILLEKESGTFTIINFYERRARRILPALFFVMLISIFAAWFLLIPSDMKSFSNSIRDVSVFISNIFFYKNSGYFDATSELKPLLHTWSLAIEEQYYLFFPPLIIILWRFLRISIPYLLFTIAVISLIYAHTKVSIDANAAYFLLPSRLWELMVGSLLAYLVINKHIEIKGNEFASFMGLILIFYAVFFFNSSTPFPSFYALLPTLGAALIIACATPTTLVGKLLGSHILVSLGLISFSAYLWHQPLFAFARYSSSLDALSNSLMLFLSTVALVLAYFSWRFIESPFRNNSRFDRKQIFIFSATCTIVFLAFGLAGKATNGFESRLTKEQLALVSYKKYDVDSLYRSKACFLRVEQRYTDFKNICDSKSEAQSIFLWGDSHAAALYFGLEHEFGNIMQYTSSGCPPLKDAKINTRPNCKDINNYILQKIQTSKPQNIVLHANWRVYKELDPINSIKKTINYIHTVSPNSEITIVGPVPQWNPTLPNYMLRRGLTLHREQYSPNLDVDDLKYFDKEFDAIAKQDNVNFLSAINIFCLVDNCKITTAYENEIMPTAWDYGHLTRGGSVLLAKGLSENKAAK